MGPAPQYSDHYPTELGLLNLARLDAEKFIEILYKNIKAKSHKKPRTDLNLAIIEYLVLAKKRQFSRDKRIKPIHQQLQYIKRNLAHVEQLIELGATRKNPNKKQYKTLLVVAEVYRPQQKLF